MNDAKQSSDSFDPKTWLRGSGSDDSEPAKVDPARRPTPSSKTPSDVLAACAVALFILLGGAAAAWLSREPPAQLAAGPIAIADGANQK